MEKHGDEESHETHLGHRLKGAFQLICHFSRVCAIHRRTQMFPFCRQQHIFQFANYLNCVVLIDLVTIRQ